MNTSQNLLKYFALFTLLSPFGVRAAEQNASDVLDAARKSPAFEQLLKTEKQKIVTQSGLPGGDEGESTMRIFKVSEECGEHCHSDYIILRELWWSHSDYRYSFAVKASVLWQIDSEGSPTTFSIKKMSRIKL